MPTVTLAAQCLVSGQDRDTITLERGLRQGRYLRVLAGHESWRHFHLRHPGTKAREALRQLATDRSTAEHDQPLRYLVEFCKLVPQGVAGEVTNLIEPRQRRHERMRPGGDDDAARGQAPRAAVVECNLHRPRINDACVALQHLHAQARVALDAVMRFDGANHLLHTLHNLAKTELRRGWLKAVAISIAHGCAPLAHS